MPYPALLIVACLQGEVQGLGGVELVLAQCQLDRESPLAREWALWGVRNLCEGNPRAQVGVPRGILPDPATGCWAGVHLASCLATAGAGGGLLTAAC